MAIADDFSVDFVTGDIRYTASPPTTTYTVLELHRYLQDLADDAQAAGGANDDILDISSLTPSERITDEIINLLGVFNIDDITARQLFGGSIQQGSAATETLYSGLRVLGSVISSATQLQVVQDKSLPEGDTPFWGTQASPYNGGGSILMRILVKSRENGCDIDGKRIIVQSRNFGDTYAFFEVTLSTGESVAAIGTVDDPQNDTGQSTVAAYTHVTNTEGFQQIDIGDGNGNQPYYSKWTYGADDESDQLKSVWEWVKNLTRTGTALTIHGIDGELFRGVTHTYVYQTLSGDFTEDEEIVWGTGVTYDSLAGGTFTVGNYIRFGTGGNAGRVMYDNGSTFCVVALEDVTGTITPVDTEVMTEYAVGSGATSVTAAVDTTTPVADPTLDGGSGLLLADDETGLKHHIQLRTGLAPVDTLEVRGLSSGATADVNTTVTGRTITPVFYGSFVGSTIGGFGLGVDADDLSFPDTVTDLDDDINSAPNNVTWSLNGVEIGEDYCLVGPKAVGDDFEWDEMSLTTTLDAVNETAVVIDTAMPANTPQAGWLRVTLDDGRRRKVQYASWSGTTFTLVTAVNAAVQIDVDDVADTFTRASGSFLTDGFTPGMRILGANFANGGNNAQFTILTVTALVITVVDGTGMVTETGDNDETLTSQGHDFNTPNDDATSGNDVMRSFIDKLAESDPETFTTVFTSPDTLWTRVRDGGVTPIKTYEAQSSLGSAGGSATASRISDA